MRKLAEFAAFFSIAVGAHALALVVHTPERDPQSAGAQGTELLSLTASSEAVAALVEQWETPPEITVPQPGIAAPVAPPAPSMPEITMPEAPQISTAGIALPQMTAPSAPDLPHVQRTTPAPAAEPAITASLRPMTRPAPPKPPTPQKATAKPAPEPKKAASVASRASNAAKAAGQGGQQAAGNNRTSDQAGLSPARKSSLMREWAAAIHSRIARNVPRGAGEGKATLRVTVGADGSLHGVSLLTSSGKAKIDQVAIAAVKKAGRFPPAPKGISVSAQSFQLPVLSN